MTKPTRQPEAKATDQDAAPLLRNEGEGSSSAGRHYDEQATEYAESGAPEDAAVAARAYVDAHPDEAAAAEQAGKRGAAPKQAPQPAKQTAKPRSAP